jgi:16S rRNA (uracil1498-N3)-methyltransferase
VPVLAERVGGVTTRFQASHVEKATARAREAVKQCGATWSPAVVAPMSLGEAIRQPPGAHGGAGVVKLLADADGGPMPPLREGAAVTWAIGPEGGFTEEEVAQLKGAGFSPVNLGRATLRFDTAAVAALALTAAFRGRMKEGS